MRQAIFNRLFVVFGILTLGAVARPALAASSVYFTNGSGERLCLAIGENPAVAGGVSLVIQGWNCIEPRGTLTISLEDGIRYVIIKDSSGRDYVGRNPTRFSSEQGYFPNEETPRFGLSIFASIEGYFTSRHYFGDGVWSIPESAPDFETLEAKLLEAGFRKVNAWKFNKSDYPGGIGILLGEFG